MPLASKTPPAPVMYGHPVKLFSVDRKKYIEIEKWSSGRQAFVLNASASSAANALPMSVWTDPQKFQVPEPYSMYLKKDDVFRLGEITIKDGWKCKHWDFEKNGVLGVVGIGNVDWAPGYAPYNSNPDWNLTLVKKTIGDGNDFIYSNTDVLLKIGPSGKQKYIGIDGGRLVQVDRESDAALFNLRSDASDAALSWTGFEDPDTDFSTNLSLIPVNQTVAFIALALGIAGAGLIVLLIAKGNLWLALPVFAATMVLLLYALLASGVASVLEGGGGKAGGGQSFGGENCQNSDGHCENVFDNVGARKGQCISNCCGKTGSLNNATCEWPAFVCRLADRQGNIIAGPTCVSSQGECYAKAMDMELNVNKGPGNCGFGGGFTTQDFVEVKPVPYTSKCTSLSLNGPETIINYVGDQPATDYPQNTGFWDFMNDCRTCAVGCSGTDVSESCFISGHDCINNQVYCDMAA